MDNMTECNRYHLVTMLREATYKGTWLLQTTEYQFPSVPSVDRVGTADCFDVKRDA